MHVHFMQMSERVALKWLLLRVVLLFAKALLCAVSVVKGDRVHGGATTSCVQREIRVFLWLSIECTCVTNRSVIFWFE